MWRVDAMRPGDVDAAAEVEQTAYASPDGAGELRRELEREVSRIDVLRRHHRGVEQVVALCNYWLICDEIHLLSLATHAAFRRRGCAARLLRHLVAMGRQGGYARITLEVRPSNAPALSLYRRYGFRDAGRRRGYYADGEDALVLVRELTPSGRGGA